MSLHVEVVGSGPPLVLVHGWGLHGGVFAPLVARLRERFEMHVVDLPGHGHSRLHGAPLTLHAASQAVQEATPPAPWIAWSLGGLLALHAAASSSQVQALALIASTPRFVRGIDWTDAVEPELFDRFGQDLDLDYRGTLQRFIALDTIGSEHAREELRTLKQALFARGEPTPAALRQGLDLLRQSDLRAVLPRLSVPSLWLSGRRDRLVPPAAMAAASQRCGGRHIDIAGGGHAPFLGQADAVAAALLEFLQVPVAGGTSR